MILIVGLGNPGEKYKKTRHNVGFLVLDSFKRGKNFSNWKENKRLKAKISEGDIDRCEVVLAEPQTYMNNSGISVKLLVTRYSLLVTNLFVVHDDLDIPLGQFKISQSRGSAGHKGAQSIIDELKTKGFIRFRIGIGGTQSAKCKAQNLKEFVLKEFSEKEKKIFRRVRKRACEVLETAIKHGVEKAMSNFN